MAPLLVGEVSLWCGTVEVGSALSGATHQVLLDAHAQVPVGAGDVHQPGEGVVAGHVLHLGQVGELLARLSVSGRLVDRAEQRLCLASWVQVGLRLKLLLELILLKLLLWLSKEIWLPWLELLFLRSEVIKPLRLQILRG